jgi:hypothetical protein
VPRTFVVTLPDGFLVFDSPFSEALDEYEPDYSVYFLPWSEAHLLHDGWNEFAKRGQLRGRIPVNEVEFDEWSRRSMVATTAVERFAKPS